MASAAPYAATPHSSVGAAICPIYPFGPGPSASISTTTPFPGETVTISGANFDKNAHVSVVMSSPTVTLATATTSSSGAFTVHTAIPGNASGTKTISVVGGAPAECPPNSLVIHLQAGPNSGPPLSFTGVEIGAIVAVALALLVGGVLFATAGRRRTGKTRV
jgi:hypothetical protein